MNEAIQVLGSQTELAAEQTTIFEQIDSLINRLLSKEGELDHGYAKLGLLLVEVSEQELWREAGFKSFDTYLSSLIDKYHKGRTQMYAFFTSVREMKPYLTEGQMNDMGISKLSELKKATMKLGFPPNTAVMEKALDPRATVADVRKAIAQHHHFTQDEQENKTWFDLGGFYVNDNEKMVIKEAFEAAWRTDPVVQRSIKNEIRTKEGLLRMAMEYLSTHGDAAERGEA